jgi:molecular chaperone GrpE
MDTTQEKHIHDLEQKQEAAKDKAMGQEANPETRTQENAEERAAEHKAEAEKKAQEAEVENSENNEVLELKEKLLRTMAEFENYKKRSERELQDMAKYAMTHFAKDLLPVADNFARALEAIPQESLQESNLLKGIYEGVKMTEAELEKAFKKHQVIKVSPLNEPFDHNFHQAIMEVEESGKESGTVVEVLQSGYKIHDRLLRPAMVKVAK